MRTATVHISDVEAIRRCSRHEVTLYNYPNISLALLRHATHLSISLRLPVELCSALEQSENIATLPPHLLSIANSWSTLGSNLSQLPDLVRLALWLDHDKPCPWAMVSERAIFSPLSGLFLRERLKICVSLPKLHPKYENTDRHFTDCATTPFILYRRYRQRYHQGQTTKGAPKIIRQVDFPILVDEPGFDSMPIAELEELERKIWESGRDPELFFEELYGPVNEHLWF